MKAQIKQSDKDGPETTSKLQDTPPAILEKNPVVLNDTYYIARFNDKGYIEGYHKEKQFIIPVNSEVRFFLDCGSKISNQAKLLVNKPLLNTKTGELDYTITQPFSNEDSDEEKFKGSELSTTQLQGYEPDESVSQYSLVFVVPFTESGSFFVQLVY